MDLAPKPLMSCLYGVAIGAFLCVSAVAEPPATQTEVLALSQSESLRAELQLLQDRLATLRKTQNISADCWADAQIYVNAVKSALEFGPISDANAVALVTAGIRLAQQRTDALSAGQRPWRQQSGRSVRGFISDIDGSAQPYGLIVPKNHDSAKPVRLDVVLHGSRIADGTGQLLFLRTLAADDEDSATSSINPYIELFPMGRLGENAYRFEGETDVYEAIEAVCRDFRIDRSRIVLRGHSLGAVGAWQLGLKRPDRFVAIGPAAGPVDTIEFANSPWKHFVRLAPLTDWQKPTLHLIDAVDYIANAAMIPVVAAMGDKDPYFSSHLLARSAFAKERLPFIELVDPGAGHGISDRVMQRQLELLSEHADRGINPFPKHIRFVTWTVKYSRCHWVEILGLQQHYARAQIDAHVARDGSIRIEAPANITRFAIHPPAAGPNLRRVTIDGQSISLPELPAGETKPIVIETRQGAWACPGTLNRLALKGKRPGLQGPIDDAFATRFICVRGTAEAWHPDVGAWAEANLNRFADEWRRYYCADLPIKNDSEITADDLKTSNLILFGDPKSNRWIKTILPQLPLRWTQDQLQVGEQSFPARDHGLQLIYPNPLGGGEGRYVVFNSGHTYHKQELQFSYMVFPRLGDWAIMKLGNNKLSTSKSEVGEAVVTSGFFGEDWELKSR